MLKRPFSTHKATVTFLSHTSPLLDIFVSFSRQAAQAMMIKPTRTIYPVATTPSQPFIPSHYPTSIEQAIEYEATGRQGNAKDTRAISYESSRYTVNKSPFAHGRHQDQFVFRTYKRQLALFDSDSEAIKRYLHYITESMPAGIGLEYEIIDHEELPAE